ARCDIQMTQSPGSLSVSLGDSVTMTCQSKERDTITFKGSSNDIPAHYLQYQEKQRANPNLLIHVISNLTSGATTHFSGRKYNKCFVEGIHLNTDKATSNKSTVNMINNGEYSNLFLKDLNKMIDKFLICKMKFLFHKDRVNIALGFGVSEFMLKSLIHLDLSFVHGDRYGPIYSLLHVDIQ
ncbi:hypothetical protein STEG23_018248, partial [Scotinomys teguina]